MPGWLSSLRDLIADASPLRRFMLALLVLLPLAALASAYLWFNPPAYRVLYTQLSDRAGGEVIGALERLDIPYRLSAARGRHHRSAVRSCMRHAICLAALGQPRTDADAQDEIDRSPRFGTSSLQEQQRYQRALEIDLARSIQKLDTVELARVHLALPKVSPFLRDAPPATAAVLVRLRPGARLDAGQVSTIQTLVAASVPRLKRAEVQVFDPRGVVLGGVVPEAAQTQRLALEQDLARRALAVLTPGWVQTESACRRPQRWRTAKPGRRSSACAMSWWPGRSRPLERPCAPPRVPEGRVQRINAIVILAFDASAGELRRAGQLARQALDLLPARGDNLSVYALPAVAPKMQADVAVSLPPRRHPARSPRCSPASPLPNAESPFHFSQWPLAAAAATLAVLGVAGWRRVRRAPASEMQADDFDAELDAARSQVLADPRVAADVIRLWMRA